MKVIALGVSALVLALPGASAAVPESPPASPSAGERYTPLVASVLNEPTPVLGADGRLHLAYEFLILNPVPFTIAVSRVEVLDAGRGNRLLDDLRGPRLEAALSSFVGGAPTVIEGGQTRRAMLDVSLPAGAAPRALVHRITVAEVPLPVLANPLLAAPTTVSADRPVAVAPPLHGPRWLDLAGCCAAAGAHRASTEPINGGLHVGQRFAVDLARVWPDGRLTNGPADDVTSFAAYGEPAVAAAAGRVVSVKDGQADQIPFRATPPGEPGTVAGNSVILDIGLGRYLGYAHLKPGSVVVAPGDRVREGQTLGLVGNSGNSDLPHLHFQAMDAPSILMSSGLPVVLRSFDSPGSIPPVDQIDLEQPIPVRPVLAGHFTQVIPMDLQVLDLG